MIDLIEMYVHWYAGRSQAQIAESLGIDRKTVRKYLAPVDAAGLVPGGPPVLSEADWRERAAGWFPEVVDKGLRQLTWPAIGAHRDYITDQLKADVTVATIHQRLVRMTTPFGPTVMACFGPTAALESWVRAWAARVVMALI